MEKYFAVDDRNRRLNRTICLLHGQPVHVSCSDPLGKQALADDEVFVASLKTAGTNIYSKIKYTDDSFQARSFPLGYISHKNGATYLARIPSQQQRQGLCYEVVDAVGGDAMPHSWFVSAQMHDCIMGNHLTFNDAVDAVVSTGRAHSFDRLWCVSPHHKTAYNLAFKGRNVGLVSGKAITLFKGRETRLLHRLLQEKGLYANEYDTDHTRNPWAAKANRWGRHRGGG